MIPDLVDKRLLTPIIIRETSATPPVSLPDPIPAVAPVVVPTSDIIPAQVTSSDLPSTVNVSSTDKKFSLNYICLLLTGFIFYILWF